MSPSPDAIDVAENRERFQVLIEKLATLKDRERVGLWLAQEPGDARSVEVSPGGPGHGRLLTPVEPRSSGPTGLSRYDIWRYLEVRRQVFDWIIES